MIGQNDPIQNVFSKEMKAKIKLQVIFFDLIIAVIKQRVEKWAYNNEKTSAQNALIIQAYQ